MASLNLCIVCSWFVSRFELCQYYPAVIVYWTRQKRLFKLYFTLEKRKCIDINHFWPFFTPKCSPIDISNACLLLLDSMPENLVIIFFGWFFACLLSMMVHTSSAPKRIAHKKIYRFVQTWQMHFLHSSLPLWLNIKIELYISLSAFALSLCFRRFCVQCNGRSSLSWSVWTRLCVWVEWQKWTNSIEKRKTKMKSNGMSNTWTEGERNEWIRAS